MTSRELNAVIRYQIFLDYLMVEVASILALVYYQHMTTIYQDPGLKFPENTLLVHS